MSRLQEAPNAVECYTPATAREHRKGILSWARVVWVDRKQSAPGVETLLDTWLARACENHALPWRHNIEYEVPGGGGRWIFKVGDIRHCSIAVEPPGSPR